MPLIEEIPVDKPDGGRESVKVLIVAVEQTAGSALYGMVDVLMAAGNLWQAMAREPEHRMFHVDIVALDRAPFRCGHGIPVIPDFSITDNPGGEILILPELWLGPDESLHGQYPALIAWIKRKFQEGITIYSACSGTVMLAETGLLNGYEATSHWGYQDLFRKHYPEVHFQAQPNLVFSDPSARIVTAGGATSWHDLALHIIARHGSPGEALRIAKVYLLKWHEESQLPFTPLVRRSLHGDSVVRHCETWLAEHFRENGALQKLVEVSDIPERSLKRRFKAATGHTLIEHLHNLRVEEAKKMLETAHSPVAEISAAVGYEDISFFRALFRRLTGLTPGQYRRLFQPILRDGEQKRSCEQVV